VANPAPFASTALSGGTYTLVVTDDEGCVGTGTVAVTVNPAVAVTATVADNIVCVGDNIDLGSSITGGSGTYVTFAWSGPDSYTNSVANPAPFASTALSGGTYTLVVTDDEGCVGTGTVAVTVNPAPATPLIGLATDVSGPFYNYTATSTYENDKRIGYRVTNGPFASYVWSFATVPPTGTAFFGSTATDTVALDFGDAGTVELQVVVTDGSGCTSSNTITITVNPTIKVNVSAFLEGPFNGSDMDAVLNDGSPYTLLDDNYGFATATAPTGLEWANVRRNFTVPANAVDVVEVAIRTTPGGADVQRTLAWLLNDGSVRDFFTGTKSFAEFQGAVPNDYYVVVRHRNHVAIISSSSYAVTATAANVDLTLPANVAIDADSYGFKTISGKACMYAGDVVPIQAGQAPYEVNALDLFVEQIEQLPAPSNVYNNADADLDGDVDAADFTNCSVNNDQLYRAGFANPQP
jgi:hypothetical protein